MKVTVAKTGTPGRMLARARSNLLLLDATPARDGPHEAPSAGELFLSGLIGCAAVIIEHQARVRGLPLSELSVEASADQVEGEPGQYAFIDIHVAGGGVDAAQLEGLVVAYRQECPIFRLTTTGMAAAGRDVSLSVEARQ